MLITYRWTKKAPTSLRQWCRHIVIIIRIINLSSRGLNSLTYQDLSKDKSVILLILKTRNHPSFVISTIDTFVVLYLTISLVTELDIETTSRDSWDCKDSKHCYQPAGHIVTEVLKIITYSIICKVRLQKIARALQEFCNHWCKREHDESNALNT